MQKICAIFIGCVWGLCALQTDASKFVDEGSIILDGSVDADYNLLSESGFANQPGGQTSFSDATGEGPSNDRWDGSANQVIGTSGDIQSLYATWDVNNLYLALQGPTVHQGANATSGDGDVFIAIDAALGRNKPASGSLGADEGWGSDAAGTGFGGGTSYTEAKAVDFEGWTPNFVIAVQYYNSGSDGYAEIVELTDDNTVTSNTPDTAGAFAWDSNGDTLEFSIDWDVLGLTGFVPGPAEVASFRLTAYTTYNESGYDTYDTGPGIGQDDVYEELGDRPGDTDSGGALGSQDQGSFPSGSVPSSNFVDLSGYTGVGQGDQVDTMGGYLSFSVGSIPEPGTFTMGLFGLLCLRFFRRHM